MADYKKLIDPINKKEDTRIILRVKDNAYVPNDPDNVDWQAYQDWLTKGNEPDEPSLTS